MVVVAYRDFMPTRPEAMVIIVVSSIEVFAPTLSLVTSEPTSPTTTAAEMPIE